MKKALLVICAFLITLPLYPHATDGEIHADRDEIFAFLEDAFRAQVSLSEKLRSREEVESILSGYFTDEYAKLFWDANVAKESGKYVTYGSDFAPYYIPYYQFSDHTKVVVEKNKAYVFEFFPGTDEGPVAYDNHYEGLLLIKERDGWKVAEYLYNTIPESIIKKAEGQITAANASKANSNQTDGPKQVRAATFLFGVCLSPMDTLIGLG
ncbi:hypothetical protein A8F94_12065 [Bacillus sp. FJAT-27225]|uniref:DUF3993 domain-containing protein n=1 Tax=Bacillus sp. FJAT-27225 TaxID=1743144 RepID=UPI00080C2F2B|nr:DUF3993 domain-containing protein [Bacillus sp. FJAT-27225]OCA85610.1 hypothetical protein A8F94_12065 [Bacillus sp. FJAT-27225]